MNEAESPIHAAVAAAPIILVSLDRQGTFTMCEGRALHLLELAPADVVGRCIFEVGAPRMIEAYHRAMNGETFITTLELNGLTFETRCSPMVDDCGRSRGVVAVATNVTESARLVDALGEANRFKSDMVAIIAHELRTPLNAIMGYTDLMLEGEFGPLTNEQREISRRVDRSAQVLRDLVAGTLELSRLDSGQFPLNFRECDLHHLIDEVDAETSEYLAKPGVVMRWQTATELPSLYTDPLKVKVILKNLIANALKFTSRGEISITACAADNAVVLTVADTGIGIGADLLPHIFEPFRQGERHSARRFGGVGLGLYLVKRLVEVLGGSVEVESTRDCGSVFRVRLPLVHPTQEVFRRQPASSHRTAFRADHAA